VKKRWLVPIGVVIVFGALTPAVAQGRRSTVTPGVSHTWREVDAALVGFEDLPYFRLAHRVSELRGDKGGEKAYLYMSWRERRFATRTATTCGGLRYLGRYVVITTGNAGEGWFGLEDRYGSAHLKITHSIFIYKTKGLVGPPICSETTGTWSGSLGVMGGYEGTFLLADDGTLTLR
jgi:hypothetical protein